MQGTSLLPPLTTILYSVSLAASAPTYPRVNMQENAEGAGLALALIRHAAGSVPQERSVPEGAFVADEELLSRLAAAPKPVRCIVKPHQGGIELMLKPDKPDRGDVDWSDSMIFGLLKEHDVRYVSIRAGNESFLLSIDGLLSWSANYLFDFPFALALDSLPDPSAGRHHAHVRLERGGYAGALE